MPKLFIFIACIIGYAGATLPPSRIQVRNIRQRQSDGPSSPFDHSNIKSLASLGDSFAAGIGAGKRLGGWGDWYCSRYDSSYPSLLNSDPSLGDNAGRTFQYFACSDAITTDVTTKQVTSLKDPLPQMATLTVGGNDAKLSDILAACIFNWNKDPRLDCDKALSDSQAAIDAPEFAQNFDALLNALKGKMASGDSKIFWTGYSHFWDTSTNECDSTTWMFLFNIGNRQYLTQDRRIKMNALVDSVNQKIQDAIGRFGDQAVYVPWGADVDYIHGHFCEPGVDESGSNAINREQTAFYEWGTTIDDKDEPSDNDELRRRQDPGVLQDGQDLNNTWEGQIAAAVLEGIAAGATPADYGLDDGDVIQAQSGLLLPDKYGRVFHPQRYAHLMIAENILRIMDNIAAKAMGQKAATTTLIGCPAPTGPASHGGEHNSCYSGSPDKQVKFSLDTANAAIDTYCKKHKSETVRVGDGILDKVPNGNDAATSLVLRASLDTEPPCQNYPNLGKWNFYDCQSNMASAMNDCDTDTTTDKLGGTRTADCIEYSISSFQNPPTADYAAGQCSLHLSQTRKEPGGGGGGGDPFSNGEGGPLVYSVQIDIFDNDKVNIGHHDDAVAGAGNSLSVTSKLKDPLVITPEERDDYIRFTIGTETWASNDKGDARKCSVGGWDPRHENPATRQMDCSFDC